MGTGKPEMFGSTLTEDEYLRLCAQVGEVPSVAPRQEGQGEATHVFAGYGTEAQARQFADWCRRAGVSRHVELPTGGRSYVLRPAAERSQ